MQRLAAVSGDNSRAAGRSGENVLLVERISTGATAGLDLG